MKINTNISALRANFNLNSVQSQLTASTNKLSSGYRITKAADDAAGMAISQKMHAQIRGLQRASKTVQMVFLLFRRQKVFSLRLKICYSAAVNFQYRRQTAV